MNEKAIIETVKVVQPKLRREDLLQVLKYRCATKAWDKDKKKFRLFGSRDKSSAGTHC